jgi:threonine/homoserine/homoserine lactone efflux protein
LEFIYLFFLGLVVGLSGAMIPGPLLIYTIAESMRKGALTGF